ncbi:unannotated protein [freshwater metagenome]|uniref:Unannotated protein n=1 Tax=freshwater metagenome TaxID=449393 RepID=A0A6J5ZH46_9ZZZZ|nr:DUF305 domain-containing protein [Actinomycetota bacterium]
MSRSRILFAGGLIAALIIGIFVGGLFNHGGDEHEGGSHQSSNSESRFSDDDVMFAQMMIPHHEQAIVMSDLALNISANPEILALATAIRSAQAPEIVQMKSWIDGDDSDSHAGHGMSMDGMLTESEIETLRNSTGATFDRLFIEGMIGHHEGAIEMVEIIDGSKNSEVKELAANIVSSQSAEITAMKELLTRLP